MIFSKDKKNSVMFIQLNAGEACIRTIGIGVSLPLNSVVNFNTLKFNGKKSNTLNAIESKFLNRFFQVTT